MNTSSGGPSPFTKMCQVYWEAKQSFNKSLGEHEDNFIVSSDSNLDRKLDLLQTADNSFDALMKVILKYCDALQILVNVEENFGLALIEYGTKDSTAAGKIMCMSGKTLCKTAQRQIQLKTYLMNLFHEVQTFQFKAVSDALQTVAKMEKVRKSYRSGLVWLKSESKDLDPDVSKRLRNFRKVQKHIKQLKVKFDGAKLESMQKIDLLLLSRCNLFSQTLVPYQKAFKKMSKHTAIFMNHTLENIPLCSAYDFVALRELNQYSKILRHAFQKQQPLEEISRKQKNMEPIEKLKSTSSLLSEESVNMNHSEYYFNSKDTKNNVFKFGDHENDKLNYFRTNKSSDDNSLIDFNDDVNLNSRKISTENKNPPPFKYSEDLLSVNFDNYRTPYRSEVPANKLENVFEKHSSFESNSPQNDSTNETADLKFWSLIKNYDQTSNLTELNKSEIDNSASVSPKPSTSSGSIWDAVLIQFDPFFEEMTDRKIKTEYLELC